MRRAKRTPILAGWGPPLTEPILALGLDMLQSPPGPDRGLLMDLGAGDGHMVPFFEQLGYRVTCVDIDWSALVQRPQGADTPAVRADAQHLPFAGGSFDAVYCNSVFQYVDRRQALAEVHRVLRPGGSLVAVENLHGSPFARLARARLKHMGHRYPPYQHPRRHLRRSELSIYREVFTTVESRVFNLLAAGAGMLALRFFPATAMPALTRAFRPLHAFDRLCFRAAPILEHLGWHVVIRARA